MSGRYNVVFEGEVVPGKHIDAGKKGIGCLEALAYGTALTLKNEIHAARTEDQR